MKNFELGDKVVVTGYMKNEDVKVYTCRKKGVYCGKRILNKSTNVHLVAVSKKQLMYVPNSEIEKDDVHAK